MIVPMRRFLRISEVGFAGYVLAAYEGTNDAAKKSVTVEARDLGRTQLGPFDDGGSTRAGSGPEVARGLLGRPTNSSATLNLIAAKDGKVY